MSRNNEVLAGPKIETLVNAANPEARAYTIDGVTIPDFDAFAGSGINVHDICHNYIVQRDDMGLSITANFQPDSKKLKIDHDSMDTIKTWALESIDALHIDIPEEGMPVKFFLFFLFGPVKDLQAKTNTWHMDMDDGALTIFEEDPTQTMDEELQDAYPLRDDRELVLIDDSELRQYARQPLEGHIRQPANGQTLYVGRRNIHRQPPLIPGQMRKGVICFLNSEV